MSSVFAWVPKSVQRPIGNCASFVQRNYEKAQVAYGRLEDRVVAFSNARLPEAYAPTAEKVIRAMPETLFCVSMFTGVGRAFATGIWALRTIQLLSPVVVSAVTKGIERETMDEAVSETKERFANTVAKFGPAMFVTGAVGAVAAATFGAFRCNVTLVMQAAMFGALSYHGYQAMQTPAAASEPVAATP